MTDDQRPEASPPSATPDRWSIWFFRLVQTMGAGTFVEQVVVGQHGRERPWILLISLAMMFGALGIEMALRAMLRMVGTGSAR